MEGEEITGPWRATRLWNNINRNFRSGMPTKKHKKNLRTYEDCFSSTEAIDWLHKNLQKNPNFGSDVTKEQTILLLKKLFRAGVIENVREDANDDEFKVSGELYKFSNKSPAKNLRTPGKGERRPLADTGNTPRAARSRERAKEEPQEKPERDKSVNRKAREEMKRQLNLSYFQALPSNSLIILDNDDTWRRVYMDQLSRVLSSKHTGRLDYAGQLDMETVMHNMTKVSAKGIVQVADRGEDLPHWVLSAMKCLANWPKQLKTVNGKESCLPNYEGFEHDVFNVVKDYFLTLPGPLTTCPLYEFILEAYAKAEGKEEAQRSQQDSRMQADINCGLHPGSINRPCSRPYTETNLDPPHGNQFYTMITNNEDLSVLSNQERVARIKQTFQILPPLATSSLQNSNTSNTTLLSSGHSTFDTISYSLSPDMTTTAIMKQFMPPNTCFETAFVEESPVTRIVPQKEHETLHIKRSWSGRSLSHIPTDWATKNTATQTDTKEENSGSLKRIPKWKRAGRFRKSIAVMETQDRRRSSSTSTSGSESGGIVNGAFRDTPVSNNPGGGQPRVEARTRQLYSSSDLPNPASSVPIRGYSSVDNLLDRENQFEEQFMMKYKQVSGDLRSSCDLVDLSRRNETKDRSFIESKALRKEKKKRRIRNSSTDRLGYDTDNDVKYSDQYRLEESLQHCYINRGMEASPVQRTKAAPLASHDISELSPVPFSRHTKYNASYRLATNQPATPSQRFCIPRTSTQIDLQHNHHNNNNNNQVLKNKHLTPEDCLYVRAEPYNCLNSDVSNSLASEKLGRENLYTRSGAGPIQRYSAQPSQQPITNPAFIPRKPFDSLRPDSFSRNTAHRASRASQATVDSGRYSDFSRGSVRARVAPPAPSSLSDCGNYARYSQTLPHSVLAEKLQNVAKSNPARIEERAVEIFKLLCLLVPPSNRRKLQLLLKFIKKVSLNTELVLEAGQSNLDVSLETFTSVILRPQDVFSSNTAINAKIALLFVNRYDEIWSPPESLRREVEEKVYESLVNKRIEAGEDPYPVTYCRQVTKTEYENSKLTGAESGLLDLLNAILVDRKMTDKEKIKKMKKFKESYPQIWRKKFPSDSCEPDLGPKKDKQNKFSSLSRIKNVMRM